MIFFSLTTNNATNVRAFVDDALSKACYTYIAFTKFPCDFTFPGDASSAIRNVFIYEYKIDY